MKPVRKLALKQERGQILVILAIGIVGIFAIAGLAIDGSRVYQAKRQNQSTADSAVLTAAGVAQNFIKEAQPEIFYCDLDDATALTRQASDVGLTSAQIGAAQDGVTLARYDISTNGVTSRCGVDGVRTYMDFTAKVTSITETTLARVIGIDTLPASATASVRIYPYQSAAYGNAISSLNPVCGGINFGGTIELTIYKGGVFSNSCIDGNGGPQVDVQTSGIQYGIGYTPPDSAGGFISPEPEHTNDRINTENLITPPSCPSSGYSAPPSVNGVPGAYAGIKVNNNATLTLAPGLYCINGDIDVGANGTLNAQGVTFAMVGGSTKFNGTANLFLHAPTCDSNADPDCIPAGFTAATAYLKGILFYVFPSNVTTITLNGNSTNDYTGMIYAPTSLVKITGTSDSKTFNTQIIAWDVAIEGNARLQMDQSSADTFHYQSSMDMSK